MDSERRVAIMELTMLAKWVRTGDYVRDDARDEIARAIENRIRELSKDVPAENQIVVVAGGIAQYRGGVFYTGMEDPRYARPIQWKVTQWMPLPKEP